MLEPLLVWTETSRFGEGGYLGTQVLDMRVAPSADRQTIAHCKAEIDRLCRPCNGQLAAKKLTELRALTVHRARDGIDVELMAGAYLQRLAQYPADVVVAACDGWANCEEFWPSWAELKAECDKRMRGRLQIKRALASGPQ